QAVAEAYQEAPNVVVLLNPGALPKTSSGKVQRAACAIRYADGSLDSYAQFPGVQTPASEVALASDLHNQIAAIWCEQLQLTSVAADDHFFLLGGNSITATQVVARLRETLGLELNLRLLFEAPTLATFAASVAQLQHDGGVAQGAIQRLSRQEELPQSLAQNRLWI
ncbi:MAG: phosphopantetheine-binding protein, partial [Pseudomonas sp.]